MSTLLETAAPRRAARVFTVPAVSWAFYDFANTIFSYAVITRYFNEWILIERDKPDWYVGVMRLVVSLVLVFALPYFGALADSQGRRKPLLIAFTLAAIVATALLGLIDTTMAALVLAALAIFAFQSAGAQYDPLLADVAPPETRGRVSGLGTGLGFVGVLVALGLFVLIVPEDQNQRAFLPTAALFLVFALPCFLFVSEPRRRGVAAGRATREAFGQVVNALRLARAREGVLRFLLARFLYLDAISTVITYMTVYAKRTAGFSGGERTALLALSVVFAALGAFGGGMLTERIGPKRVLIGILVLFAGALGVEAASGAGQLLWVIGPLVGITLGAVGASDRIFLLRLIPASQRGEFFGISGLVGKLSSGFGPFVLWSGTIWLAITLFDSMGKPGASRIAMIALAAASGVGILVLRPLSDAPRPGSA
jgi:MFS transporter, UMF1 family